MYNEEKNIMVVKIQRLTIELYKYLEHPDVKLNDKEKSYVLGKIDSHEDMLDVLNDRKVRDLPDFPAFITENSSETKIERGSIVTIDEDGIGKYGGEQKMVVKGISPHNDSLAMLMRRSNRTGKWYRYQAVHKDLLNVVGKTCEVPKAGQYALDSELDWI